MGRGRHSNSVPGCKCERRHPRMYIYVRRIARRTHLRLRIHEIRALLSASRRALVGRPTVNDSHLTCMTPSKLAWLNSVWIVASTRKSGLRGPCARLRERQRQGYSSPKCRVSGVIPGRPENSRSSSPPEWFLLLGAYVQKCLSGATTVDATHIHKADRG